MRTLRDRDDLWHAFDVLCELWSPEKILDDLTSYLGDDVMRRFIENDIREWDAGGCFSDYEEFAEEEEEEE